MAPISFHETLFRATVSVCQSSLSLATVVLQLLRQLLGGLIEGEDFQFRDMRVASAVATNAAPEVSIRVKPCSERL